MRDSHLGTSAFLNFETDSGSVLSEELFHQALFVEQRRTERSQNRFILALVEAVDQISRDTDRTILPRLLRSLSEGLRQTDIVGWYKSGSTLGIIFTELGEASGKSICAALLSKISLALGQVLDIGQLHQIRLCFRAYPGDWKCEESLDGIDLSRWHGNRPVHGARRGEELAKRGLDILGSVAAISVLSPVLALVALAVKLTSAGPVLFRQSRVGKGGRSFTFLKFRSMACSNDPAAHQEYMRKFIAGTEDGGSGDSKGKPVFKMKNDPRVTPIGRFLRRSSLDELPQFFNVLWGDMSLVGPRPPIPYEVDLYRAWHRRRILEVKPGITGLWQVAGRSRVGFDEMVRLDLRYARTWTLWMDLKILLRTPRAVLGGSGAF